MIYLATFLAGLLVGWFLGVATVLSRSGLMALFRALEELDDK